MAEETRNRSGAGSPDFNLAGQILDQRYKVERLIANGGMASVWLAKKLDINRDVALKVLHQRFVNDSTIVRLYHNEAQSAGQLTHPHIVPIIETGTLSGRYHYIAMEFVEGVDLKAQIVAKRQLSIKEVSRILTDIGSALNYAHSKGIVHCDVKSKNILLDRRGHALLTDFGIAQAIEASGQHHKGAAIGTPQYMAPEQFGSGSKLVDMRTDLYSLGVVAYEMITGQLPFVTDNVEMYGELHARQKPLSVRLHRRSVPNAISGVIDRALSKQPEQRPQSVAEFLGPFSRTTSSTSSPVPKPMIWVSAGIVFVFWAAAFFIGRTLP